MAMTTHDAPIACRLTGDAYESRRQTVEALLAQALESRTLPDGVAFRFPGGLAMESALLDFVRSERECCPFFTFELRWEPYYGPLWLRLTGPEGTAEFVGSLAGGEP